MPIVRYLQFQLFHWHCQQVFYLVLWLALLLFLLVERLVFILVTLFCIMKMQLFLPIVPFFWFQLAASIAFLIARYFARERILKLVEGNKKFLAIDKAIGENGFRVVTLLRLSPLLPFSLGNYLYGLTSVKFVPYVLGRSASFLRILWLLVYFWWQMVLVELSFEFLNFCKWYWMQLVV